MDPTPLTTAPPVLYGVYLAVSLALTSLLAVTLFRNGRTFLRDVFDDKPEMADALNRLLVVGFFMWNAGYALLIFRGEDARATARPADFAMDRLGLLLVTLGVIHFVNMAVFWKIRHRAHTANRPRAARREQPWGNPPPPAPAPIAWDRAAPAPAAGPHAGR